MRLISEIEIKGFRSIRDGSLKNLGDFTAFAGLNNSGKSNVLRALNAFFNNHTDGQQILSVDKDYYRPDLVKKKTKRISISVTFTLPEEFKFRKGLDGVETLLGSRSFRIKKEWIRSETLPAYHLNESPKLELDERQKIDQFLQLINFRYIPNRVLPIDVISNEHQSLRDVLIRRLGKKAKGHDKAFDALHQTSKTMIQALANRFQDACPDVGEIRLATPTSWSDMVFAFGYRLGHDGVEIEDDAQGSGIQSLLMLETLYLIDRDYFQQFGWRQGAIWAVEEPESSLHATLEARVASYLSSVSGDASSRLQVLCTTHSDLMLQYAKKAVVVMQVNGQTLFEPTNDIRTALEILSRSGISRWAHPILHYPLDPLILVEGKYDQAFFEEAFKHLRPKRRIQVRYLEQLGNGKSTGGIDDLLRYTRENVQAIKSRQRDSPVIIILDWDAAGKKETFSRLFAVDDAMEVFVWPESAFNPSLGKSFRGIERHYSNRMIKEAERRGVSLARKLDGICVIEKDEYSKAKEVLFEIVKEGLRLEDFEHAKDFLEEVLKCSVGMK
ncbi:ATP-dependent nuclease [Nitrospira sp. Nam74]